MTKGKHKAASRTARYISTSALGLTSLALTPGIAHAAPQEAWDAVAQCESGNQNIENATSTASGYFQIIDGTWRQFGGLEYAPRAIEATYEQQLAVAERILAGQGPGAWVNGCGDPLIGQASEDRGAPTLTEEQPVPPAAPVEEAPVEEPAPLDVPTGTYTVQQGDTLARVFGQEWARIAELNGIVSPFMIFPGQVLVTEATPIEYIVEEGDALWSIASAHDTDIVELYQENREVIGDNPDLIFPGQELVVRRNGPLPPVPPPAKAAEPVAPIVPVPSGRPVDGKGVVRPVPGAAGDGLGAGRGHDGVDLACEIGDPVVAALGGVVQNTREFVGGTPYTGYGLVVDIVGWDGALYRYAHLSRVDVAIGEPVSSGEQIGLCGNTGAVVAGPGGDGSHLHFERRPDGQMYGPPSDAAGWLAAHGV